MANLRKFALSLGLFSCLVVASTTVHASTGTYVQKHKNSWQQFTITGYVSGPVFVYYNAPPFMPGVLPGEIKLDHPNFAYPIPVNDPKRNNRLFPFAQHERDWNVASHYRS